MIENVYYILSLGVLFLAGFAWLIRLEAKVLYQERAFDEYRDQQRGKNEQIWTKLESVDQKASEIKTSVARIEGQLNNKE